MAARVSSIFFVVVVFVQKFTAAVDALVRDGYWLRPEGDAAKKAAAETPLGR